jgi:hypothetical protein
MKAANTRRSIPHTTPEIKRMPIFLSLLALLVALPRFAERDSNSLLLRLASPHFSFNVGTDGFSGRALL